MTNGWKWSDLFISFSIYLSYVSILFLFTFSASLPSSHFQHRLSNYLSFSLLRFKVWSPHFSPLFIFAKFSWLLFFEPSSITVLPHRCIFLWLDYFLSFFCSSSSITVLSKISALLCAFLNDSAISNSLSQRDLRTGKRTERNRLSSLLPITPPTLRKRMIDWEGERRK